MLRTAPSDARVLIAGAGPVGMAGALELERAGNPATVLERADDLTKDLRASTWHPPTLVRDVEALRIGALRSILRRGSSARSASRS
jgi:2-polyprenyl-6-methoxyphenol hydroxylase-like FAD-dependent oxidoreductase